MRCQHYLLVFRPLNVTQKYDAVPDFLAKWFNRHCPAKWCAVVDCRVSLHHIIERIERIFDPTALHFPDSRSEDKELWFDL